MKDATDRIEWLEAMRELNTAKKKKPLKLITLKIDEDFLEAFKLKCKIDGIGYTTRIKQLMLNDLESSK